MRKQKNGHAMRELKLRKCECGYAWTSDSSACPDCRYDEELTMESMAMVRMIESTIILLRKESVCAWARKPENAIRKRQKSRFIAAN